MVMPDVMLTYSFSCAKEKKERKRMIYETCHNARPSFQVVDLPGFPHGMLLHMDYGQSSSVSSVQEIECNIK